MPDFDQYIQFLKTTPSPKQTWYWRSYKNIHCVAPNDLIQRRFHLYNSGLWMGNIEYKRSA